MTTLNDDFGRTVNKDVEGGRVAWLVESPGGSSLSRRQAERMLQSQAVADKPVVGARTLLQCAACRASQAPPIVNYGL